MIRTMLDTVHRAVDVDRVLRRAEAIWQSDRWLTASAWRRTAQYVAAELSAAGARDVGIVECPADGESVLLGQRMWPVWEVREASLEILGRRAQVICRYRDRPTSLMSFSSPTPKGGIETELVRVDDGRRNEDYRGLNVAGKIVFTRQHGGEVVSAAARRGAVGLLSDFIVTRDSRYLTRWMPTLTLLELVPDPPDWDRHCQWMAISDYEAGLFGFVLPCAEGERLRARLRKGAVRVRAVVDAAFSKGSYPAVTGIVPGIRRNGGQVLAVSHLYEQGANDNASGCAVSLEIAGCLTALIRRGALPRPERTVRFLYGLEMQGPAAYLHAHHDEIGRTVAALCLDCVGADPGKAQSPMCLSRNPEDRPSFTDPLLEWLTRSWLDSRDAGYQWTSLPYDNGTDNFIAEREIGIPCPWLGQVERVWHTTADTPALLDRRSLTHASVIGAGYCYYLAQAGAREAEVLLALSERYGQRQLLTCSDRHAERISARAGRRGRSVLAAVEALRLERDRSLARLETVLPLVTRQRKLHIVDLVAHARSHLRSFARAQERRLRALGP